MAAYDRRRSHFGWEVRHMANSITTFNPEHGFYPWMSTIAYMLDREEREITSKADVWRPIFDSGSTPAQAIISDAGRAALEASR